MLFNKIAAVNALVAFLICNMAFVSSQPRGLNANDGLGIRGMRKLQMDMDGGMNMDGNGPALST